MATKLLWLGIDITDVQRFLGHENIETTRHYAETTAATLHRKNSIRSRIRPRGHCFRESGTIVVMMPHSWRLTCFRQIEVSGLSHLLVHENQMLAGNTRL
ncbi:tyrosine-type recombinase/integrase [Pararhizobium sp. A13]|uniref:tyrosine-type recombinase/integrase n=1 Tax=Pararhizobium sp. A13 TaxID=3133975 RepID=UPI00311AD30B